MTHEETIKRIQKLVPSIMELEFGCEVIWHNPYHDKDELFKINAIKYHNKKDFIVMMTPITKSAIRDIEDIYKFDERILGKDFEILGKPITLAVIMLATATEYNPKNTSTFLNIDSNGEFCWTTTTDLRGGTMKVIEPIISWNLSKDKFNDQSEETKTFIGGLLN